MKNEININPNLSTITFKCKYETCLERNFL